MPYDFSGVSAPPNQGLSQEELRRLIEQQKQQAQSTSEGQAKPAAQQQAKPQAAAPAKQPEKAGPPAPGEQGGAGTLAGIGKFIEEKIAIPTVDFFDNTFQGDQKTPDQIAQERSGQRADSVRNNIQAQQAIESGPAGHVLGEGVRAVLGSGEDLVEGLVNLPFQALDAVSGYSHTPIRSNIIRENETGVGQGLRTLSRYVLSSRLGSAALGGKLTAGQTGGALFAGRFGQGFVEDFLGADGSGEDGTLIGNTPFTRMLQTADENQALHNRALVGIEGGLFEAVGMPAVRAFLNLRKSTKLRNALGIKSREAIASGKLQQSLLDLQAKYGDQLQTPLAELSTDEQIASVLADVRQKLSDPNVLRNAKDLKKLTDYNQMLRTAAAPRLMREADASVSGQLRELFPGSQNVPEAELLRRLQQGDPERFNLLLAEAADTADETDPIFQYVAGRVEAIQAAEELDQVANTIQYGGAPDELVIDGTRLPEYTDELTALDQVAASTDEQMAQFRAAIGENVQQTNELAQSGGKPTFEIAQLQAKLPELPTQADLAKASEINLSVSKAQVARLEQVQLPEGITITAGRRVKGLTPDNIDEFRAAVAELGVSGDKVASNLSSRLDNLELPEAPAADTLTREAAQAQLDELTAARNQQFDQSVQNRLARRDLGAQMRDLKAKSDAVRVQREARLSRLTGNQPQFQADYQPVNMTTQNVSSIVKERAGGQPGFDLFFEDKRFPALLDGRVKEIGRQGGNGSGYGNYIVVESIDPKTGKSVDVIYSHLEDGSINVKEGDMVGTGQQIAKQGGTGRVVSQDGTIASVDFLAPAAKGSKSMTPYSRWSELVDELSDGIRKGSLEPSQVGRKAPGVPPQVIDEAAQQADEAIAPKTRAQAIDEGFEVDELIPARPRTDLLETFSTEPHQTVVGTAQPGKASLTDIDVYSLNNGTPEGMNLLLEQVQKIDRALLYGEAETIAKIEGADDLARQWLDMGDDSDILKSLEDPSIASQVEGHQLLGAKGYAASGLVLRELQNQLTDLGYNVIRHDTLGSPEAQKEAVRMLDRMQSMLKIRTTHKQVASGKLRELQYIGENLGRPDGVGFGSQGGNKAKVLEEMIANYKDQLAKDQKIYETFSALKNEIRKGNPAAFAQLKRVAQGMTLIQPTAQNFNAMQTLLAATGKNTDALYVNSLLSGPVTTTRNFWGNFYQTMGNPMLSYFGAIKPGKKHARVRAEATAAIGAMVESRNDLIGLFARATREQWSVLGKSTMDAAESGIKEYAMWDEALEANMKRVEAMKDAGELHWHQEMMYSFAVNWRRALESPVFRPMMALMGGADNTFKVLAGRQLAARRAVVDAIEKMGDAPMTGKRAQEFAELVAANKEYQMGIIFEPGTMKVVDQEAVELGQVFTFQQPVGEADHLTKGLNSLSSVPFMKTLGLTFIKTPSNILKGTANLTPVLSSILKRMDAKYKNGSDYYRAMRDGAEAMSYILGGSTAYLGATGVMTGAGPLSGKERDVWLQSHKPFTITIGEFEINYQGWEPAATVMGLFADLGAMGAAGDASIMGATTSIMSNIVNKSYLTQISTMAQVIGAVSEKDYKRLGENIARGLTPFSSMRSQWGQIIDPAYREVRSQIEPTWSWFLKKQGGLGSTMALPQKVDEVTGKPLTRDGIGSGIPTFLGQVFTGTRFSKNRFEKVHRFLDEVGLDVSNGLNKVGDIDLTNEEMTEYIKLRADGGKISKDLLSYFHSDRYQALKKEMEYDLSIGKEYSETRAYDGAKAIVQGHHQRAIAIMKLGLTDVTAGFSKRYREAQKGAFQAERRTNQSLDVLRPKAGQPINTTLLY